MTLPEVDKSLPKGPLAAIALYTPHMTKYEEAVFQLNQFFLPKKNSSYERHIFRAIQQGTEESVDLFAIRLRIQAEKCSWKIEETSENVMEQLIRGCKSSAMRKEMLKQGDVGMNEVLRVARIFEAVNQQEKTFETSSRSTETVSHVGDVNKIEVRASQSQNRGNQALECGRCGYRGHKASDERCPARGKVCSTCKGKDHFFRKCRSRKRQSNWVKKELPSKYEKQDDKDSEPNEKKGKTEAVQNVSDECVQYVFQISTKKVNNEISCKIGGIGTTMIVDSGSKFNLMDKDKWNQLKALNVKVSEQKKGSNQTFKAYGGYKLNVLGTFKAEVRIQDKSVEAEFYVIEETGKILLGHDTATEMGILSINASVNQIGDSVQEFPKIKNVTVEIPIRPGVIPVAQPYRRVPIALEEIVDRKINELERQGIIEKVNEPSSWISPVVVVEKKSEDGVISEKNLRVCIDMRRANEAVQRENHPLPTFEDFLPHIGKGKLFSKLDIKNAFHQVDKMKY